MSEHGGGGEAGGEAVPAWVVTFADMVSLLMCFFVIMLSFANQDLKKFKDMAGAMRQTFGVQNEIFAKDTPKGTSMVALEYSPGRPDPAAVPDMRQRTTADLHPFLIENKDGSDGDSGKGKSAKAKVKTLSTQLSKEIKQGKINLEMRGDIIILRVFENGVFAKDSANLDPSFIPSLSRIKQALAEIPDGSLNVEGHTDDADTGKNFSSAWSLSAERAIAVVNELTKSNQIPKERFVVKAFGDTRPLLPNTSEENRAKNRRIEIVIEQDTHRNKKAREKKELEQQEIDILTTNHESKATINAPQQQDQGYGLQFDDVFSFIRKKENTVKSP